MVTLGRCHLQTGQLRTIYFKKCCVFTLVPVYSSFSSFKRIQTALKVSYAFSCQILAYILLLTTLKTRTPSQTVFASLSLSSWGEKTHAACWSGLWRATLSRHKPEIVCALHHCPSYPDHHCICHLDCWSLWLHHCPLQSAFIKQSGGCTSKSDLTSLLLCSLPICCSSNSLHRLRASLVCPSLYLQSLSFSCTLAHCITPTLGSFSFYKHG